MTQKQPDMTTVAGFAFESESTAVKAAKELEAIKYIKAKTNMEQPEMVLKVYQRLIAENMFETAVGRCFLKELQDYLATIPFMKKEDIIPIPVKAVTAKEVRAAKPQKEEPPQKRQAEKQVVRIEKNTNYKSRYQTFCTISVILLLMVAAMFAITLTSNNPNILNYENEIINKYENWEQQLDEREAMLNEKEAALDSMTE